LDKLGAVRGDGRASVSGKFTGKEMGRESRRGKSRRGIVVFLAAPGRLRVLKAASRRWQRRAQALDTHLLEELR
jgi:hypothetical protein